MVRAQIQSDRDERQTCCNQQQAETLLTTPETGTPGSTGTVGIAGIVEDSDTASCR
jgi:hypothetical protein